nr:hypothetical protein [Tanacetum cinerariifolium]
MARQCSKPKRKRDATWFREKVLLVEAQGNGKVLTKDELEFLADPGCDEISTAKAVLMANLSSYGSDVLSEVPNSDNTHNDMLNQSVQEMPYSEPSHFVERSENEIHSDSNIILPMLYDGNVIAKETNVVSIADSKETLMLKEESRSKMFLKQSDPMVLQKKVNTKTIDYVELNLLSEDFGKCFVLRQELSNEQDLHLIIDQSASLPI